MEKGQTAPSLQQCFVLQLFCVLLFLNIRMSMHIHMRVHTHKENHVSRYHHFLFSPNMYWGRHESGIYHVKTSSVMVFKMISNCAKVTAGSTAQTTRLEEANKGCLKAQKVRRL